MKASEIGASTAVLSGKRVTVVLPQGAARSMSVQQEPEPAAPSVSSVMLEEWLELLRERNADIRATVSSLSARIDENEKKLAESMERIQKLQNSLIELMHRVADSNNAVVAMLKCPVVPEYDKKGKLISARRVVQQ